MAAWSVSVRRLLGVGFHQYDELVKIGHTFLTTVCNDRVRPSGAPEFDCATEGFFRRLACARWGSSGLSLPDANHALCGVSLQRWSRPRRPSIGG